MGKPVIIKSMWNDAPRTKQCALPYLNDNAPTNYSTLTSYWAHASTSSCTGFTWATLSVLARRPCHEADLHCTSAGAECTRHCPRQTHACSNADEWRPLISRRCHGLRISSSSWKRLVARTFGKRLFGLAPILLRSCTTWMKEFSYEAVKNRLCSRTTSSLYDLLQLTISLDQSASRDTEMIR